VKRVLRPVNKVPQVVVVSIVNKSLHLQYIDNARRDLLREEERENGKNEFNQQESTENVAEAFEKTYVFTQCTDAADKRQHEDDEANDENDNREIEDNSEDVVVLGVKRVDAVGHESVLLGECPRTDHDQSDAGKPENGVEEEHEELECVAHFGVVVGL